MKTYSAFRGELEQPQKKNGDEDGYEVPAKKRRTDKDRAQGSVVDGAA